MILIIVVAVVAAVMVVGFGTSSETMPGAPASSPIRPRG